MNLREIDRLVAEKVMGWKIDEQVSNDDVVAVFDEKGNWGTFKPTEWIQDAWQVVEKLKITVIPQDDGVPKWMRYLAEIDNSPFGKYYSAFAETAPLAICLAALEVVGVKVEVAK
ncbi:hypothetical protein NSR00_17815 [Aeribacillus sp. FSL K6-8394]|uniref:BC1872 family protein n=1 Tax=Aeribacillus sp. FSL K6-8394 TaxID=2954570 RepID=UPI0030FAB5EC